MLLGSSNSTNVLKKSKTNEEGNTLTVTHSKI